MDEASKLHRSARLRITTAHNRPLTQSCGSVALALQYSFLDKEHSADEFTQYRRYHSSKSSAVLYRLDASVQYRSQLFASFVSDMFPLGVASVQKSFLGSWLWHIPVHLGHNSLLDYAALSLALAYFAQVSRDRSTLQKAEISYCMALKSLAIAIADERSRLCVDVLCATMLLSSHEVGETVS